MTFSPTVIRLIMGGLFIGGVLFLIFFLRRKLTQFDAMRSVNNQLKGRSVQAVASNAYCLGFERSWDGQWKGRGILVLTRKILHFRLWKRELDMTIPLDRIESTVLCSEYGDQPLRRKHLRIVYRGADGQLRTVTWRIRRPEPWVDRMQELIERKNNDGTTETKRLPQDENPSGGPVSVG